jgi:hypothetical protein
MDLPFMVGNTLFLPGLIAAQIKFSIAARDEPITSITLSLGLILDEEAEAWPA